MSSLKTLFLDRDGVINEERPGDYVKNKDEFIFIPGVLEALAILEDYFDRIILITNQRGVGRGLMSIEDLKEIHANMLTRIQDSGGRIDKIYIATDVESSSLNRKPNPGMGLQAQQDFPEILFSSSIMIGNSLSDMQFGKKLGMKTILVGNKYKITEKDNDLIDYSFPDLLSYARTLCG
ncbi:HAD-IIIA family hydrolase [Bacteroidales bacterium OttesenSCG-928-M06]|nr:HAD-IIIA family hydrolase [Bacteroidales bacterium OttesenSCG-928-M06]